MLARPMPFEATMIAPGGRGIEIDPAVGQLQWWVQGTEKFSRIPVAGGATAEDVFYIKADKNGGGDFNPTFMTQYSLGSCRLLLEATGGINKRFTNGFVNMDFIAAPAGAFPLFFSTPLWLEAKTGLRVQVQQINADVANKVELCLHGRRLIDVTPEQRLRILEKAYLRSEWPIWLGLDDTIVTLAASQVGFRTNITVPADGDVQAEYLLVKSTGPVRIQIQDQNGNPMLYGGGPVAAGGANPNGVRSIHVAGQAVFPYRMPMGGWLDRQTILNVFLEDLSGAENNVELCIVGRCLAYKRADEGKTAGDQNFTEQPDASLQAIAYREANPMPQNPWEPARQAMPVTPAVQTPGWVPRWLSKG